MHTPTRPDDMSSGPIDERKRDLAVPATSHDHLVGRHVHSLTLTAIPSGSALVMPTGHYENVYDSSAGVGHAVWERDSVPLDHPEADATSESIRAPVNCPQPEPASRRLFARISAVDSSQTRGSTSASGGPVHGELEHVARGNACLGRRPDGTDRVHHCPEVHLHGLPARAASQRRPGCETGIPSRRSTAPRAAPKTH